ncbi:MAG: MFS transporter [Chloroflexi bacterium]|nr:MFS transporter [Chloroflexota bacterium]
MLPLFVLAHFGHHLIAALLSPLLPFIRDDFALDYTQAGWLVSAWMVSYGISQLPGGWLVDRIGSLTVIVIGVSGVALSGLLVGLSPTYIMMGVFLVILGITGGGYHPALIPLISASVDSEKRGRALGLHQIGGTASFFLAPLIAVAIAATAVIAAAGIGAARQRRRSLAHLTEPGRQSKI